LRQTVGEASDDQEGRTEEGARDDPHDGAEQVAVASTRDGVQHQVKCACDEIGDAERHPVTAEGARRCEGHDEHRRDRGEHGQPGGAFLGIEGIRQPRVCGPGPPEHAEEQQAAEETTPRRAVREESRHLRDREHEDEIEEELQGPDLLSALGLPIVDAEPGHCSPRTQRGTSFVVADRLRGLDAADDACCVTAVLGAVRVIDPIVDVIVRVDEADVLLDAAGQDPAFVATWVPRNQAAVRPFTDRT